MNSWELALKNLDELIKATGQAPDIAGRAGIYAAACIIHDNLWKHVVDELGGPDVYIKEKLCGVKSHIGAAVGFDVDNGHDASQHRSWAYGDLSTLKGCLEGRLQPSED